MINQDLFYALFNVLDTNTLETGKQLLYDHLMQSPGDIQNGDVCSRDEAIDAVLKELDSISV